MEARLPILSAVSLEFKAVQHGLAEKEIVCRVFLLVKSNYMQIRSANCLNKILKSS